MTYHSSSKLVPAKAIRPSSFVLKNDAPIIPLVDYSALIALWMVVICIRHIHPLKLVKIRSKNGRNSKKTVMRSQNRFSSMIDSMDQLLNTWSNRLINSRSIQVIISFRGLTIQIRSKNWGLSQIKSRIAWLKLLNWMKKANSLTSLL